MKQWNYLVNGLISVFLHDLREASPTYRKTIIFLYGDNKNSVNYKFPPGVAHGYKCINGPIIYQEKISYSFPISGGELYEKVVNRAWQIFCEKRGEYETIILN